MTRDKHQGTHGFTMIELLIVLAVIAILAAVALIGLRPDPTRQLATEITQLNQQARYESINTNTLLLSTWNHNTNTWEIGVANPSNPCLASTPLRSSTSYKSVTASTRNLHGIVWQPNGLPVTCAGPSNPVAQQRLTLSSGRRSTTIAFDSRGRGQLQ